MRLGNALVLLAVLGCKKDPDKAERPTPTEKPSAPAVKPKTGRDLAAHYLDCVGLANAGKWDDVKARCVTAGFTSHLMDGPEIRGVDMLVEWGKNTKAAFPDIKTAPQLVIVDGRTIFAVELTTGTHEGTLKTPQGDVPATHKTIGLVFFHKLAIDDDNKMTEEWAYKDARTFLGQLGMLPKDAGPVRAPVEKSWGAPIIVVAADDAASKANIETVKKMIGALNAHKPADTAALVTDDVVESDQAEVKDRNKAEMLQGADEFVKAFPDGKLDVPAYFAAGNYVIAPGTLTGTNDGPLGPMKPTHKKIASQYAEIYELRAGKIAAVWRFRNGMVPAQQLQ